MNNDISNKYNEVTANINRLIINKMYLLLIIEIQ